MIRSRTGVVLVAATAVLPVRGVAQECASTAPIPRPVTVQFDAPGNADGGVTITAGQYGTLRAHETGSGALLWDYTPSDQIPDPPSDGLISDAAVLRFDAGLDGAIDPNSGDRVVVYFGLRRGGRHVYALDVTQRRSPQLLWKAGPADLPGVGETWSTPTIARVHIADETQNGERLVVIFGGGHEGAMAGSGQRIFILDAISGRLLWFAGRAVGNPSPDLPLARMAASVPARVTAVDTNGDGLSDRLYAADIAGQLWRFDLGNGEPRAHFATGGVIASLGGAVSSAPQDARAFFNGPDVALIRHRGQNAYLNLAIGSGDRIRPFGTDVHDRFYSVRDYDVHGKLGQSAFDARVPQDDAALFDIANRYADTLLPPAAPGWKLELRLHGGWTGEKVLAESVTASGVLMFTTFQPDPGTTCADTGVNRVYAVTLEHGEPALDLDGDGEVTGADVAADLAQPGIAGEVELAERVAAEAGAGAAASQCSVGGELLHDCVNLEHLRRTFWQREVLD